MKRFILRIPIFILMIIICLTIFSNETLAITFNEDTGSYYCSDGIFNSKDRLNFDSREFYENKEDAQTEGNSDAQDFINILNQCDKNGKFNIDVNKKNIDAFFEKNPKDMFGKYLHYAVQETWYQLGTNAMCWHPYQYDDYGKLNSDGTTGGRKL